MKCNNCGEKVNIMDERCNNCGEKVETIENPYKGDGRKSKLVAGLLGILLGSLGIHNFYLGFTKRGILQIVISLVGGFLTCGLATSVVAIWGLIEGIMILTGRVATDAFGNDLVD